MIDSAFCHMMARYNRWQNQNLYGAADGLDDAARKLDRGAFFKSIHGTLVHLLWGDTVWMSRFDGWDAPEVAIGDSAGMLTDWAKLQGARAEADSKIVKWAEKLSAADLAGDMSWYSGAIKRDLTKPRWVLIQQLFNHQTHHRGQVHAMLTAAGARPGDTDLFVMPDET